ncbi:unnamed protein product, partial [Ectocarpus sp. 8 AP-2014]
GAALPGGGTSKGTRKGKAAAGKKMQGKKMHSSGGSRGPGAAAKTYVDINAYRTLIVSSRHRSYVKEDGTVRTSARRRSESKWFAYKDVRGINGGKDIFGLKQFDTNGKEKNLSYPSDASGKDLSGFMGLGESNRLFEGDLQTYARCAAST